MSGFCVRLFWLQHIGGNGGGGQIGIYRIMCIVLMRLEMVVRVFSGLARHRGIYSAPLVKKLFPGPRRWPIYLPPPPPPLCYTSVSQRQCYSIYLCTYSKSRFWTPKTNANRVKLLTFSSVIWLYCIFFLLFVQFLTSLTFWTSFMNVSDG